MSSGRKVNKVKTIVIRENETGDTVFRSEVTDREHLTTRERAKATEVKVTSRIDTVYIQKDSVSVEDKKIGLSASADGVSKRSGFLTYVKWITALVCAVVVLIITIKVCLRRR